MCSAFLLLWGVTYGEEKWEDIVSTYGGYTWLHSWSQQMQW